MGLKDLSVSANVAKYGQVKVESSVPDAYDMLALAGSTVPVYATADEAIQQTTATPTRRQGCITISLLLLIQSISSSVCHVACRWMTLILPTRGICS